MFQVTPLAFNMGGDLKYYELLAIVSGPQPIIGSTPFCVLSMQIFYAW